MAQITRPETSSVLCCTNFSTLIMIPPGLGKCFLQSEKWERWSTSWLHTESLWWPRGGCRARVWLCWCSWGANRVQGLTKINNNILIKLKYANCCQSLDITYHWISTRMSSYVKGINFSKTLEMVGEKRTSPFQDTQIFLFLYFPVSSSPKK